MIEDSMITLSLVNQFIKENDYKLEPIEKEIDICDLCIYDEKTHKMINYGNVNNIINCNEFQEWYKNKGGEQNG